MSTGFLVGCICLGIFMVALMLLAWFNRDRPRFGIEHSVLEVVLIISISAILVFSVGYLLVELSFEGPTGDHMEFMIM